MESIFAERGTSLDAVLKDTAHVFTLTHSICGGCGHYDAEKSQELANMSNNGEAFPDGLWQTYDMGSTGRIEYEAPRTHKNLTAFIRKNVDPFNAACAHQAAELTDLLAKGHGQGNEFKSTKQAKVMDLLAGGEPLCCFNVRQYFKTRAAAIRQGRVGYLKPTKYAYDHVRHTQYVTFYNASTAWPPRRPTSDNAPQAQTTRYEALDQRQGQKESKKRDQSKVTGANQGKQVFRM
jgi:hypothetical protein